MAPHSTRTSPQALHNNNTNHSNFTEWALGDGHGEPTKYQTYLLYNLNKDDLTTLYNLKANREITKESFVSEEHVHILPHFVCLSDTSFTFLIQLRVAYHSLAHYYPLDFNTNRGTFGKCKGYSKAA